VFWVFDYKKSIFTGKEYDISNEHKKLHRITYILSENIVRM
jgi:hypothetical protein